MLEKELTINIDQTILWSDSTTVLTWLKSESCRFKVFVGIHVAEIQELTVRHIWRYVDSARNPTDDVTRGKTLKDLVELNRWSQGPPFLLLSPDQWPEVSVVDQAEDASEMRKSTFCGVTVASSSQSASDRSQYNSWRELLEATAQELHGAANSNSHPTAEDFCQAEKLVLQRAQMDSFQQEYNLMKAGKPVPRSSRLLTLSPELAVSGDLICVGGRLRRAADFEQTALDCFGPFEVKVGRRLEKRWGILFKCLTTRGGAPGPPYGY